MSCWRIRCKIHKEAGGASNGMCTTQLPQRWLNSGRASTSYLKSNRSMELGMMRYLSSFAIVIACVAIGLTGCGGGVSGGGGPPPAITTQILSDSGFDGDIQQ